MSALFADGSVEERARLVYDVFDGNQDGRLSRQELESTLDRLPIAVMYSLAVRVGADRGIVSSSVVPCSCVGVKDGVGASVAGGCDVVRRQVVHNSSVSQ